MEIVGWMSTLSSMTCQSFRGSSGVSAVSKGRARKKPTNKMNRKVEAQRPTEFDKLLRFIVTFQGRFALAFICGEDRRQRQGVLASLADLLRAKGIDLRQIDLTYREVTDLFSTMKEECHQYSPAAIVVTGIEASLKGKLLASLNIQRDLISREVNCPLLFWVSNFALTVIAREAPDFYDFRYTVFNFRSAKDRQPLMNQDTILRDHTALFGLGQGAESRTTFLFDQLERYQKDEDRLEPLDRMAYGELLEEVARSYRDKIYRTEALIYLERALKIYSELQEKGREAAVLKAIRDIYYLADNQVKAAENLAKALETYREIGDRLGEANVLWSQGYVKHMQGASAEAEQLYSKAFGIYASIDDKYGQSATLLLLAEVYRALGDQEKARSLADQAKELLASFPQMVQKGEHTMQELS
jgi:tetratricopeptide (TPR) repeat protein